jgi:hypothetical protein
MPGKTTVFEWLAEDAAFADQYARAKEAGIEAMAEEVLDISDNATNDWMERHGQDDAGWQANGEHIQRSRLRVDSRKWLLSKLAPKKYGDRTTLAGDPENPLQVHGTLSLSSATQGLLDEMSRE